VAGCGPSYTSGVAQTISNYKLSEKKLSIGHAGRKRPLRAVLYEQRYLLLMSLPFLGWLLLFKYVPIWGWTMAFQDYRPGRPFFEQEWVGLQQFARVFTDQRFYAVMRNTFAMSILGLVVGTVSAIVFALLLNELRSPRYKRAVQTISYLPHFVSWVVVASIFTRLLSVSGPVNDVLVRLGVIERPFQFFLQGRLFWWLVTFITAWKDTGWNAIIYLAAISAIDPQLYEAAWVDGANRFQQMRHITIPGIMPTVTVILIMNIGWLVSTGFERQMLLGNPIVMDYAEVLDLYVLNYGIRMGRFSFGTALGIFKSLLSVLLVLGANFGVRRARLNAIL